MNKRSCQATGQSPDGHRVTLARRVLREPLPLRRLSGGRGGPGRGDRGGEKAAPTVGQDAGRLESRGWRRAFTLRLQIHPRPPQPSHPPARPLPRWRGSSGAGQGPGSGAGHMRERLGTARAHDPRKSRQGPRNGLLSCARQGRQRSNPCFAWLVYWGNLSTSLAQRFSQSL